MKYMALLAPLNGRAETADAGVRNQSNTWLDAGHSGAARGQSVRAQAMAAPG
jgi:hypothetical protein